MAENFDTVALNRAGRRAAEKRSRRMRTTGAVLAAGAATFGTTATVIGVTASSAGASELTVTNLNATGAGSLHDVAEGAADGDVIVFQAGLTGTITLTDEINVDTSITVQGPGAGVIDVKGPAGQQIFDIDGPSSSARIDVVISGLTLSDGSGGFGGAIQVDDANLTVRDAVLTGNDATGGGGAIAGEDDNMDLVIENSQITGNTADGEGGGIYWYSDGGSMTVTGSAVDNNTASGEGGGIWTELFESTAPFTLTNSSVSGNTAGDNGGGLSVYFTPVAITNSTISGNTAGDAGGGAFIYYTPGDLTIANSTISGNTASSSGGGLVGSSRVDLQACKLEYSIVSPK